MGLSYSVSKRLPYKILCYYIGTEKEYTVYKPEGVSLVMGLHLLSRINSRFTHSTILGSDSQVVIRALDNQCLHPSQYILNIIHQLAKNLHRKQDGLINCTEREAAIAESKQWIGRHKGIINLQVHWVPDHVNFACNEKVD